MPSGHGSGAVEPSDGHWVASGHGAQSLACGDAAKDPWGHLEQASPSAEYEPGAQAWHPPSEAWNPLKQAKAHPWVNALLAGFCGQAWTGQVPFWNPGPAKKKPGGGALEQSAVAHSAEAEKYLPVAGCSGQASQAPAEREPQFRLRRPGWQSR